MRRLTETDFNSLRGKKDDIGEEFIIVNTANLPNGLMGNLYWMIPLQLSAELIFPVLMRQHQISLSPWNRR